MSEEGLHALAALARTFVEAADERVMNGEDYFDAYHSARYPLVVMLDELREEGGLDLRGTISLLYDMGAIDIEPYDSRNEIRECVASCGFISGDGASVPRWHAPDCAALAAIGDLESVLAQ